MGYFQDRVIGKLNQVLANQRYIMAAIDDLNTSVDKLVAEEVQILADIKTIIANSTGTSDATLAAVQARIDAVTSALQAGDPIPPVVTGG